MPKSLDIGKVKLKGVSVKDPRVAMRAVIGVLLVANLAAAVMAFKPFGGSSDDLRREQSALGRQLTDIQKRIDASRRLVEKVEMARHEGDQFFSKYILDARTLASTLREELNRTAKEAGVKVLPQQISPVAIEGSDTLQMMSIQANYEGTYANLKKFVDLLDKSPRFLIIENMTLQSPQQQQQQQAGQVVTVSLKLDAFVRETTGASS